MSDELLGVARFTFGPGSDVEEYKRSSRRCLEIVAARDTGTLQYDVYLDDGETAAVVIERYRDEAAAAEHLEHLGSELMQAVLATASSVEGEALGRMSAEYRQQNGGSGVRLMGPLFTWSAGESTPPT